MSLLIRNANKNDLDFIIDFQEKMALETEDLRLNKATLTEGVHAAFHDVSKGQYFVAEFDGKVVGSFLITYEWSDWRNGTVMWMQSVYVEKKYRKIGVFKKMYNHLKGLVDKDDRLKGIRLYVDKSNKAAQNVYERMDMENHHYEMFEWMKQ